MRALRRWAPVLVAGLALGGCGGDDSGEQPSGEPAVDPKVAFGEALGELRSACTSAAGAADPDSLVTEETNRVVTTYEALPDKAGQEGPIQAAIGVLQEVCQANAAADGLIARTGIEPEPGGSELGGSEQAASEEDCDALGINQEERKEGFCIDPGGLRVKVANPGNTATTPQMDVRLVSTETTDTLSSDVGTERAEGTFVVVTLEVTNKLSSPATFEAEGQTELVLNDNNFTPDFDAMNMPGDSFVWNSDPIQPGNSRTGTVVFDVSEKAADDLDQGGNVYVFQFSDASASSIEEIEGTAAVLRTYD